MLTAANGRVALKLDSLDRLVGAKMQISRLARQLPDRLRRNMGVSASGAGVIAAFGAHSIGHDVDLPVSRGFACRFQRPLTGEKVVGLAGIAHQIQRYDRIFGQRSALHEEHLVIRRNREQLAQIGDRASLQGHEVLAAMTHFHHRHAGALPVEHFIGCLAQHRLWNQRRARGKVEDLAGHCGLPDAGASASGASCAA